jgi:hypothetical protein
MKAWLERLWLLLVAAALAIFALLLLAIIVPAMYDFEPSSPGARLMSIPWYYFAVLSATSFVSSAKLDTVRPSFLPFHIVAPFPQTCARRNCLVVAVHSSKRATSALRICGSARAELLLDGIAHTPDSRSQPTDVSGMQ